MKKLFPVVLVFVLLLTGFAKAQTLTGYMTDAETSEPLAFVNIGVLHRNTGTVTDLSGKFNLNTASILSSDSVKISILGYQPVVFTIADFGAYLTAHKGKVKLEPQVHQLKDVVIKPRKTKTITTGNTTDSRFMRAGFVSNDLGSELGTVLRYNKKKPGKLENVNFNIAANDYNTVLFRVNIYEFRNGQVGENLLKEPLYTDFSAHNGTLSLDLSEQDIYITSDCLLTLEWIKDYGQRGLFFSAGFFNADSYARKTSHGNWFKVPAGLGYWATIVHEK